MAKTKSSNKPQTSSLRDVFQVLIQAKVQTLAEMEKLAASLGVSTSLVKKMVYSGEGGLDVWGKAFEILYNWDEAFFANLKDDLRKKSKAFESDQIWFSLRDEMGASESDMYYLAACAREAFRIKNEIEEIKQKKKNKF